MAVLCEVYHSVLGTARESTTKWRLYLTTSNAFEIIKTLNTVIVRLYAIIDLFSWVMMAKFDVYHNIYHAFELSYSQSKVLTSH